MYTYIPKSLSLLTTATCRNCCRNTDPGFSRILSNMQLFGQTGARRPCLGETPSAFRDIPAVYPLVEATADVEGAHSSPALGANSGGGVPADAAGGVGVGVGGGTAKKQALPPRPPCRVSPPPWTSQDLVTPH
jgi:hypothetical protein